MHMNKNTLISLMNNCLCWQADTFCWGCGDHVHIEDKISLVHFKLFNMPFLLIDWIAQN